MIQVPNRDSYDIDDDDRSGKKQHRKECSGSVKGCKNQAQQGGVCKKYGAKEECAGVTEQWSNNVVTKDAQTKLRKEECALALGMGQRSNCASIFDDLFCHDGGSEVIIFGYRRNSNRRLIYEVISMVLPDPWRWDLILILHFISYIVYAILTLSLGTLH
eukprot:scaffold27073_cov135-Skeletonema_menzelii.AAC.2